MRNGESFGALVIARTNAGPGGQMVIVLECGHVRTDFCDDDRCEKLHCLLLAGKAVTDILFHLLELLFQVHEVVPRETDHVAAMLTKASVEVLQ